MASGLHRPRVVEGEERELAAETARGDAAIGIRQHQQRRRGHPGMRRNEAAGGRHLLRVGVAESRGQRDPQAGLPVAHPQAPHLELRHGHEVRQLELSILNLTMTNLRTVMGSMDLDELLSQRDQINVKLMSVVDDATSPWGVKITRIEIKDISPPAELVDAMARQMKAERERRAMILEAEGQKKSAILTAEGVRQSAILEAEGEAEAIRKVADAEKFKLLTVAEGEGQAIERVYSAIHNGRPTNDLIAIKYLEALAQIADGKASKVFLPLETSGILGSIAGIGELLKEKLGGSENQ